MVMLRTPEEWRGMEAEILPPIHTSEYNQRAVPLVQEYILESVEVVLSYSEYVYQGWILEQFLKEKIFPPLHPQLCDTEEAMESCLYCICIHAVLVVTQQEQQKV